MSDDSRTRELATGEAIFHEGDAGSEMYFVEQGRVEIRHRTHDREETLAEILPGQFFGELSLFDEGPRTASAVATRDTRLVCFTKKEFEAAIGQNPELAVFLIEDLCTRLRKADLYVKGLLQRRSVDDEELQATVTHLRAIMAARIKA